ncbi:MAG: flavoprotein, partial [Actinomycetota bacterium]
KEGRRLVIVPRESPLSLLHLRTLTALAEAGAVIAPAMPAFYTQPDALQDQVDFVAGRVLDLCGVDHDLVRRWGDEA